jgi:membrane glycosyltransferase
LARFAPIPFDTQNPELQAEEAMEWNRVCRAVNGYGKIFYRRRRINIKRKSGNIADFLRRWSRNYDFMIVLDADSVMTGEVLVRLAGIAAGRDHSNCSGHRQSRFLVCPHATVCQPSLRPSV